MKSEKMKKDKKKANRLINETSTYLLQHAYNPVDWYAWGEEALERARKEDKPILLSVGYAACHWCHVMEHESFEDDETALLMNEHFVNIKVDREERTDIDEIYMKAVQMMTGHGGWPMTVFLTPNLEPFYGGTYFPKEDRHGLPSFKRLILSIAKVWKERRDEVEESSASITGHLRGIDTIESADDTEVSLEVVLTRSVILSAAEKLLRIFDDRWGGFGTAPKFPHTFSLSLSMRCASHLAGRDPVTADAHRQVVTTTLDRMACGGIHDQIGGGFARYSVDRKWLVPHFEKMLYDNALLCRTYVDGYLLTGRSYWKDVARGIAEFVLRELTTDSGAFYSSLDADSEGEEGKFYVFTPDEIKDVLGKEDGDWLCDVYGVTHTGNFEHGTSVLNLTRSPEELAQRYNVSLAAFFEKLRELSTRLFERREKRVRPGRDEKVLTSWNSLMISAFVDIYKVTQESRYLDAALKATRFIMKELLKDGRLLRTWGQGRAKLNGYLDDYAFFVQSLLDLASVDPDPSWLKTAEVLNESIIERFWDADGKGLYYTSDDHETLLTRPRSHFDGSIPSGTSVTAMNLLRLFELTAKEQYSDRAQELLALYLPYFLRMPDQFANLICAADFFLAQPAEIALIVDKKKKAWKEMMHEIHNHYLPNKAVLVASTRNGADSPLTRDRPLVDGKATAYICYNYACDEPIKDVSKLKEKLSELTAPRSS